LAYPFRVIVGVQRAEDSENQFCGVEVEGKTVATLRARVLLVGAVAGVVAALVAPGASAGLNLGGLLGGNCGSNTSQVFAQWGDYAQYFLATNGGLESGSNGWSLRDGAAVVSGNEPFLPTGTHSLSLPSGSTATSPVTCIGPKNPFVRMFASDQAGTDSGLHVRVIWYGLLNSVLGISDFTTFDPGNGWGPSSKLNSVGGINVLIPVLGSTSARIQLSPTGSGSNWIVDDVYVDPTGWR
jgi:hypothetical protein